MNVRPKFWFVLLIITVGACLLAVISYQRRGANPDPQSASNRVTPAAEAARPAPASAPEKTSAPPVRPEPAAVRPIPNASLPYDTRLKAIEKLGPALDPKTISALYRYLETPETGENQNRRAVEHALKNSVLNRLRTQEIPPPGLAKLLIAIYRDPKQDVVMRDYAIQQLIEWYEQVGQKKAAAQPGSSDASLEEMRETLWSALTEAGSSIGGTALLGVHHLAGTFPEFAGKQVDEAAARMLTQPDTGELALITALQVCALRRLKAALPEAQRLASLSDNVPVRISAIAALGALGSGEDTAFLEALATGEQRRLQPAALAALKQIHERKARAGTKPGGGA